jgi:hypothetical protein
MKRGRSSALKKVGYSWTSRLIKAHTMAKITLLEIYGKIEWQNQNRDQWWNGRAFGGFASAVVE